MPALLPGPYELTINANGFKPIHLNGVMAGLNQRARLRFTLTIGSKTDITTVLGGRAAVQCLGHFGEHFDWQPVCGRYALEQTEL